MSTASIPLSDALSELVPAEGLPPRLTLLLVASAPDALPALAATLALDSATEVSLTTTVGGAAGLAALRTTAFDAVLIEHCPPALEALPLLEGLRGVGCELPLIVLGAAPAADVEPLMVEAGADDYCELRATAVRALLWRLARALRLRRLERACRRLQQAERQRLHREHQEAQQLLAQQRLLLSELEHLREGEAAPAAELGAPLAELTLPRPRRLGTPHAAPLPEALADRYLDLLRASIVVGGAHLAAELARLADDLTRSRATAQQALAMHFAAAEKLLEGLGRRSARHVSARADLHALELLGLLADAYRTRYDERPAPPTQRLLPGFVACGAEVRYDEAPAAHPPLATPHLRRSAA
jgi:DNA-binding response OmpR family regulator